MKGQHVEQFARGMLATRISTPTCVGTVAWCANFLLKGEARDAVIIPPKDWYSKMRGPVGFAAFVYAALAIASTS